MSRTYWCIVALAAATLTGCAGAQTVFPASTTSSDSHPLSSPDLSKRHYVITYPVAETPAYIATGSDGNLWFTTKDYVVKITTAGIETYYANGGGFATHIAAGKPGTLWYTNLNGNIGRIATDGTITTFSVPTASKTFDIAKGPDGNMWFTEQGTHSIGKITSTGVATLFAIPSAALPIGITGGPDGNIWFSGFGIGKIGRLTLDGKVTMFDIPTEKAQPFGMTVGPDGNIWFAAQARMIGRVDLKSLSK